MPILFDCVCGTELEALDGQVGRKIMCPACRSDLTVPPRSTARDTWREPVDLGIDLATSSPRPSPGPRATPAAPMNGVGLVSLGFGILSYPPTFLAWLGVAAALWAGPPFPAGLAPLAMIGNGVLGLTLAGFGLLVAGLSHQRTVRPFSAWGFGLALIPTILGLVAAGRLLAELPAVTPAPELVAAGPEPEAVPSSPAKPLPRGATRPRRTAVELGGGDRLILEVREGLPFDADTPEPDPGIVLAPGDRTVLADDLDAGGASRDVVVCADLGTLELVHSPGSPGHIERIKDLAAIGSVYAVPRGTLGTVVSVARGKLPAGQDAYEIRLGQGQERGWVSSVFVR